MMNFPDTFDLEFARQIVTHLGGDASLIADGDCWSSLGKKYAALLPAFENCIASAKTGDPALAAYRMVHYCGSAKEWAEKVIAAAKTGNPALAAYLMVHYGGSAKEWAEKVRSK